MCSLTNHEVVEEPKPVELEELGARCNTQPGGLLDGRSADPDAQDTGPDAEPVQLGEVSQALDGSPGGAPSTRSAPARSSTNHPRDAEEAIRPRSRRSSKAARMVTRETP